MLRLFRNKTTLQAPLGRWGAVVRNTREDNSVVRENSIDFNSNWANHDHCGAESCQIMNDTQKKENQETKKDETKKTYDFYNDKEIMNLFPYII
jgi:anti-sigma factor ChrR (cupin superfamily)